jgi:DNA-directed RNA polymerase specialized sigma24 family protein
VHALATLAADWPITTGGGATHRTMAAWGQASLLLASFASPADVVDAINQPGDSTKSCALLSELLTLASQDRIAARAVLQAVIPGLRAAIGKRWSKATDRGPWQSEDELAADALSAAWIAIHAHAGQRHPRPAAIIIRFVEGSLRRQHTRWTRTRYLPTLPAQRAEPSQSAIDAAFSREHQAARLVSDSQQSGAISAIEGALVANIGIYGHTLNQTAHDLRMPTGAARRSLERARHALRTRLGDPPAVDCFVWGQQVGPGNNRPEQVDRTPQQLRLPCSTGPSGCLDLDRRQPVTTANR